VAKKSKKKDKKPTTEKVPLDKPWISMRSGVIVISITSIAMAALTAWEAIPAKGLGEGIIYGILFGGLIWIIFLGFVLFRRLIH
jgi:hypothetical protein